MSLAGEESAIFSKLLSVWNGNDSLALDQTTASLPWVHCPIVPRFLLRSCRRPFKQKPCSDTSIFFFKTTSVICLSKSVQPETDFSHTLAAPHLSLSPPMLFGGTAEPSPSPLQGPVNSGPRATGPLIQTCLSTCNKHLDCLFFFFLFNKDNQRLNSESLGKDIYS